MRRAVLPSLPRGSGLYLVVVGAFAAGEMLAGALGIRFADETLGTLYQYLDVRILQEDLLAGLYYLHAQPPLFNLFLGSVLQLFPDSSATVFSIVFGGLALGVLLGTAWSMRRLGVPDAVASLVVLALALSPPFLVYRSWLFYTLPVAFLLVAGVVALARYLESGSRAALVAFSAVTAAVMLTRAVFHPLWLAGLLGLLFLYVERSRRRDLLIFASLPVLLAGLWLGKNYVELGSFSASSWLGMSLAKRWPLSQKEMSALKSEGALPPFWHRRPFLEPDELAPYGFFDGPKTTHPAVDEPYRSNGEPNFNHRDYIEISNAMLEGNLYLIKHYPGRYARRVATAVLLFLQPGPNSVHFLVDYDFRRVHAYRDVVTRYLFLGGEVERPIRMLEPPPNLLLLLVPLLVVVAASGVRREDRARSGLLAYMLYVFVWVALVVNLVEIGENDRMRGEVEPFLAVFLGYGMSRLSFRVNRRRSGVEAGTRG